MEPEGTRPIFFVDEPKAVYDKIRVNGELCDVVSGTPSGPNQITIAQLRALSPSIVGGDLTLAQSQIAEAGDGVFARRAFEAGEVVTYYQGPIYTREVYERFEALNYRYATHARQFVPGRFVQVGNRVGRRPEGSEWVTDPAVTLAEGGVGPYINDPTGLNVAPNVTFQNVDTMENQMVFYKFLRQTLKKGAKLTKLLLNAAKAVYPLDIDLDGRLVAIVATRRIAAGEELFLYYGAGYFERILGLRRAHEEDRFAKEETVEGKRRRFLALFTGMQCSQCKLFGARLRTADDATLRFCHRECYESYNAKTINK